MKIAMINGSPKIGQSNSEILLESLEKLLPNKYQITHYKINIKSLIQQEYEELCEADIYIFVFPLYVDAIPSHLFRMLVELEKHLKERMNKNITVYTIINNGFYEGKQTHIAFEIMKNWCQHCGLCFGGGIGIGAGEMLKFVQNVPMDHGPFKNFNKELILLVKNIENKNCHEVVLLSPKFPRLAWKLSSTFFFWIPLAKKNGLKKKEIRRKIV